MNCRRFRQSIKSHIVFELVAFLILMMLASGCSSSSRFVPPAPLPDDTRNISRPDESDTQIMWDGFQRQMIQPGDDFVDMGQHIRRLFGAKREAMNVNAFDDVVNSSWFTNRNTHHRLTIEDIARGSNTCDGPDTSRPWTIVRAKTIGITPGIVVRDSRGDTYAVKFDAVGYPELGSGAEVVTTKFFHAAGYHVPENYITVFDPKLLRVGEKIKFVDSKGKKRYMTEDDLHDVLHRVEQQADGKIRAMASRYVPGKPIGPWEFKGTRKDDPNDIVPHEHRRELRGLQVMCVWLNHYDTNVSNMLDSYITEDNRSYVRHYLIDFNGALGAHPAGIKPANRGNEPYVDPVHIIKRALTLGLPVAWWERPDTVRYPTIGRIHSRNFRPEKYKFIWPTQSFEHMTALDGYWGAKLVMSFTDEQIAAAVEQGQYSDPAAAAYLARILIERRDIIGRYWFTRIAPLDDFELRLGMSHIQELHFTDLAVETNLESDDSSEYRCRWFLNGKVIVPTQILSASFVDVPNLLRQQNHEELLQDQVSVRLQVKRGTSKRWSKSVTVYLERLEQTGQFEILGVRRGG